MEERISLLNIEEAISLPQVIDRRNRFKKIIKTSVMNFNNLFSNCMMIYGKPGSGKTTLVVSYLDKMKELGIINDYRRASGHITAKSLFELLKETSEINEENGLPNVLVLDDVDCLRDVNCLELMKAAFDTKSNLPTNRQVCYMSMGKKNTFKYNGFGIIITNDDFLDMETSVHLDALLDRVQQVSCDMKPEDMQIYTTHLIEDYLNKNEDELSDKEINSIVEFFNTDIRKWMSNNCFKEAKIAYTLRLIKKFIDCQKSYGSDWKMFSLPYQKLESANELILAKGNEISEEDISKKTVLKKNNVRVIKKAEYITKIVKVLRRDGRIDEVEIPPKDENGNYLKRNGSLFNEQSQVWYRRQEEKAIS